MKAWLGVPVVLLVLWAAFKIFIAPTIEHTLSASEAELANVGVLPLPVRARIAAPEPVAARAVQHAGVMVEYPLGARRHPTGIVAGPDGALWFTAYSARTIGRIAPGGAIREYAIPSARGLVGGGPVGIAAGPDGALWFTEGSADQKTGRIGRLTTAGTMRFFALPAGSAAAGIAVGGDGNLWFCETSAGLIGRLTPGGTLTHFPLPNGIRPLGIAAGPDGALWFTEALASGGIGRITTDGHVREIVLPGRIGAGAAIAAGPDGALWFTEMDGNNVGRITTKGRVIEYALPTAASVPLGIAAGRDGALWFTELAANKIGRISTSGDVREIALPSPASAPVAIAAGADGALWFTELAGAIGRMRP